MFGARNLYVYTPGFQKRQGRFKLLNMLVLGEFPKYKMVVEDGAVHMVHQQYRQYVVRVNYQYGDSGDVKIFYNLKTANNYIKTCARLYLTALIEYVTADWKRIVLKYGWHKHYCYSKVIPTVSMNILDSPQYEHPLESLLFSEYDTSARLDEEVDNILWELNTKNEESAEESAEENVEDDDDNNTDYDIGEDISNMLSYFN